MNPLEHLLPAILTALTGLQVAGVAVPVVEHLQGNTAGHYVLLTQPTDAEAGGAAGCVQDSCTALLDVVTQFRPGAISTLPAESLTSQINTRLRRVRLPLPPGWDCGPGRLLPTLQLTELNGELAAVRRLLRFRWEVYYDLTPAAPPATGFPYTLPAVLG